MADAPTPTAATAPAADDVDDTVSDQQLVEDELLVEEISIDGMCGVY
jgi:mycofactocin precursor